jgi:putative transposon-encoded protein
MMTEKELMEIKINAYQIIEKTVKTSGNSGRVYVPIDWVGKKVKVVLLEPLQAESSNGNNGGGSNVRFPDRYYKFI